MVSKYVESLFQYEFDKAEKDDYLKSLYNYLVLLGLNADEYN